MHNYSAARPRAWRAEFGAIVYYAQKQNQNIVQFAILYFSRNDAIL